MNDTPTQMDPRDVLSTWRTIENHPKFQALDAETQHEMRMLYYQQNVLQHPKFQELGRENPQLMNAFGQTFFHPEHQQLVQQQEKSDQTTNLYPQTFMEHFTKPVEPMLMDMLRSRGLPNIGTSQDIDESHFIARGIAHTAESLTSPLNVGLMAAGPIAGKAGTMLGASARTLRGVEAATSGAFAADMAHSGYESIQQIRQLNQAIDEAEKLGDPRAEHLRNLRNQAITETGLSAGLTGLVAKHALSTGRSAAFDRPLPEEQLEVQRLGYGPDYKPTIDQAQRIAQGRFAQPFAPEVKNYGPFKEPPRAKLPKGENFETGRSLAASLSPELREVLRSGKVPYDQVPVPSNVPKRYASHFRAGVKDFIENEKVTAATAAPTPTAPAAVPTEQPKPVAAAPPVEAPAPITAAPEVKPTEVETPAQRIASDEQYNAAQDIVKQYGKVSAPLLQRKMQIDRSTALSLMDRMSKENFVTGEGPQRNIRVQEPEAPKRAYTAPTPESSVKQILEREQAISDLKSRVTRVRTPEDKAKVQQSLAAAEKAKTEAVRNFAQYGDKNDVQQYVFSEEKAAHDKLVELKKFAEPLARDMAVRDLQRELRDPNTTEVRKDQIHRMLGQKRITDIRDAIGEGSTAKFRVYNQKVKDPAILQDIADTRDVLKGLLTDPDTPEALRKRAHSLLYKEIFEHDEKTGFRVRTGKFQEKNVSFVSDWGRMEKGQTVKPSKAVGLREQGAARLDEINKQLADIDVARRTKNIPESEFTGKIRDLLADKTPVQEAPVDRPALREPTLQEMTQQAEGIIGHVGNAEHLTTIRNYTEDRTDLSGDARNTLYAKALRAYIDEAIKGGGSPLEAAYKETRYAEAPKAAQPEAPAKPKGAPPSALEQALASRAEEVEAGGLDLNKPAAPNKYTVNMATGEVKVEPLQKGEFYTGEGEKPKGPPKPPPPPGKTTEIPALDEQSVKELFAAEINKGSGTPTARIKLAHGVFEMYKTLMSKQGARQADVIEKLKGVIAKSVPKGLPEMRFRSKAADITEETRIPEKSSGDQMLRSLLNAGVSPEEIKWTGLDDFLRGKAKVSKSEAREFLKQNQVKLEEIEKKSKTSLSPAQRAYARMAEWYGALGEQYTSTLNQLQDSLGSDVPQRVADGATEDVILAAAEKAAEKDDYIKGRLVEARSLQRSAQETRDWLEAHRADKPGAMAAAYEQYTLPGGSNYREVLVQLSVRDPKPVDMGRTEHGTRIGVEHLDPDTGAYRGPHFDEPNVLAHMRLKDRVTPDGKKVLFIEEIQSDWHNAGRTEGYRSEEKLAEGRKKLADNSVLESRAWDEVFSRIKNLPSPLRERLTARAGLGDRGTFEPAAVHRLINLLDIARNNPERAHTFGLDNVTSDEFLRHRDNIQEAYAPANSLYQENVSLRQKMSRLESAPPDAPFKSNWHELALRKILQEAAEKGYDKVAWTTGKMQEERYPGHVGEAHGYIYDQMIPQYLNKFGKKFGARTGESQVNVRLDMTMAGAALREQGYRFEQGNLPGEVRLLDPHDNELGRSGRDSSEMLNLLKEQGFDIGKDYPVKVPSIDITPEMRASRLVREPYTFGLPDRETRVSAGEVVRTMFSRKAEQNVEAAGMGLKYEGDSAGLTWFTDPDTGSTLAMEHREAALGPEAVRGHVFESRAKFAKAGFSKSAKAGISGMPGTLRTIFDRMPEPFKAALTYVSPSRAIKLVAANVNPALRDAMLATGVDLEAANRWTMGNMLGAYQEPPGIGLKGVQLTRPAITLRAENVIGRFFRDRTNSLTMDQTAAHEFGHRLFSSISSLTRVMSGKFSLQALNNVAPEAVQEITRIYGTEWGRLSDLDKAHEAFAETFMHYYMGTLGDSAGFAKLLDHLPDNFRDVAKNLEGQGELFRSPHGTLRIDDIAYRTQLGVPNAGLPATNPIRQLGNRIMNDLSARAIVRENLGEYKRTTGRLYNEVADWGKKFSNFTLDQYKDAMDYLEGKTTVAPRSFTPQDLQKINDIRDMFQERVDAVRQINPNMLEHLIENYWPHLFQGNSGKLAWQKLMAGKRPLQGPKGFSKPRTYDPQTGAMMYASEMVDNGAIPVSNNPIDAAFGRLHEMDRFLLGNNIKLEMKDAGLLRFYKGWGRSKQIDPTWQTINDPLFQKMRPTPNGPVPAGQWWAPPEVAKVLNNYLSPGLRGNKTFDAIREYGNLLNQAQLGLSAFHLTFEAINTSMNDFALGLQKQFIPGQRLSGLGNIARSLTGVGSVIHAYRLGSLIRDEYYDPGKHPYLSSLADAYMRAGGQMENDPFYRNAGMAALRRSWQNKAWTVLPNAMKAFYQKSSWLILDHIVPRLKAGAFADMAQSKLGDLSRRGIVDHNQINIELDKLADSVDNRMGQVVYDNLFWNKTAKDVAMLGIRSVGWNWGDLREGLGAGKDVVQMARGKQRLEMTSRMAYVMAMPIIAGYTGALVNYAMTGTGPQHAVDYFFPRTGALGPGGKPERISLPSYMRDVYSYGHAPVQTAIHKMHPMFQQLYEMYNNRNYYGQEIYHEGDPLTVKTFDQIKYVAEQYRPFSFSNYQERLRSTGSPAAAFMQSVIGITPAPQYIGETAAERAAYNYAIPHMSQGPITADEFKHRQAVDEVRNRYVAGKVTDQELNQLLDSKRLLPRDVSRIVKESQLSPLQRHISQPNFKLHEALDVWQKTFEDGAEGAKEREEILPYLMRMTKQLPNYDDRRREELEKQLDAIQ